MALRGQEKVLTTIFGEAFDFEAAAAAPSIPCKSGNRKKAKLSITGATG